jgi:hypothetical protein
MGGGQFGGAAILAGWRAKTAYRLLPFNAVVLGYISVCWARQVESAPWTHYQNYLADLVLLRCGKAGDGYPGSVRRMSANRPAQPHWPNLQGNVSRTLYLLAALCLPRCDPLPL